MDELFETFAQKICEYCMKNYVIPYLQKHGYIYSYRAKIISKNTSNHTMVIQRPFDNQITVPYTYSASSSSVGAGKECIVFCLGDDSNSAVVADGKLWNL